MHWAPRCDTFVHCIFLQENVKEEARYLGGLACSFKTYKSAASLQYPVINLLNTKRVIQLNDETAYYSD